MATLAAAAQQSASEVLKNLLFMLDVSGGLNPTVIGWYPRFETGTFPSWGEP